MNKHKDLTGQKFGLLTVISYVGKRNRSHYYVVKCDCGKEKEVRSAHLLSGNTVSCGCYNRKKSFRHGCAKKDIRLYHIWKALRARCSNPKNDRYERYGGRGITVCSEWADSPVSFFEWAYASGYDDTLSIDRKDNDKGYSPENCRWATVEQQARNKSTTKLDTDKVKLARDMYKKGKSISHIAYNFSIDSGTIRSAIKERSWKNIT